MIRIGAALVIAISAVSACGGATNTAEHAALVKFCESGGGKRQVCSCAADRTEQLVKEAAISSDMFRALVLEAQGRAEEADAILESMSIDEKFRQVAAIGEAKVSCDGASS
jgi:hypothetical protein